MACLRQRLAESPGRPLVIALGSSRAANGISPANFVDWEPRNGPRPVFFNFATLGGGPIRELLTLRRLLAHGIRPDWVVAEVWPAFWLDKGHYEEHMPILESDTQLSDVAVLHHVYRGGWDAFGRVVETNLVPAVHYRTEVFSRYAPFLVNPAAERELLRTRRSTGTPWTPGAGCRSAGPGPPPRSSPATSSWDARSPGPSSTSCTSSTTPTGRSALS